MCGSDDVCMERWGLAQKVGGVEPPVPLAIRALIHTLHRSIGTFDLLFNSTVFYIPVVQQDRSCLVSVTEDPMHLSSSIQSSFGCGTKSQHWTLEASSGQQINLRLLDFSGGAGQSEGGQCRQQYGYIVDKQAKRNVSICGNGVREKDLYLSRSNEILIVMSASEQQNFLVQFHGGLYNLAINFRHRFYCSNNQYRLFNTRLTEFLMSNCGYVIIYLDFRENVAH